jgi:hypothetical protein
VFLQSEISCCQRCGEMALENDSLLFPDLRSIFETSPKILGMENAHAATYYTSDSERIMRM